MEVFIGQIMQIFPQLLSIPFIVIYVLGIVLMFGICTKGFDIISPEFKIVHILLFMKVLTFFASLGNFCIEPVWLQDMFNSFYRLRGIFV